MTGNIIIVSGTSGAGKTTTCNMFARRAEAPYLTFGMDMLAGTMFPAQYMMFGEKRSEGYAPDNYGPMCRQALAAMHEMIAAASRSGQNMIVDHILYVDPPVLQDCIWRLEDVPVWFVCLKPPVEVLGRRQLERPVELSESAKYALEYAGPDLLKNTVQELVDIAPWMYDHVYKNHLYDLVIDTNAVCPADVCDMIAARVAEGPGTAFEELRRRHVKQLF